MCSPILLLLEGEGDGSGSSGRRKYQISSTATKSKRKGLVLSTLTRSNAYTLVLAGTIAVFLVSTLYAIFIRGCGMSKFSFIFGLGEDNDNGVKSQADVFQSGLAEVTQMAKKSVVHTKTMVAATRLNASGIWTSSSIVGPVMHILGLLATLPSLQYLLGSHYSGGKAPSASKVVVALPLDILAMFIGRGIPSLVAVATIAFIGGTLQWLSLKS